MREFQVEDQLGVEVMDCVERAKRRAIVAVRDELPVLPRVVPPRAHVKLQDFIEGHSKSRQSYSRPRTQHQKRRYSSTLQRCRRWMYDMW